MSPHNGCGKLWPWAVRGDGVSFDQAKAAIRAVASLHSKYWNQVDDPNLSHFPDYLKHQRRLVELAYLVYLPCTLHRFGHCFGSNMRRLALAYGPRVVDHLDAMAVGHRTFTHSDFRSANLF